MNTNLESTNNDEISWTDVEGFLHRQHRLLFSSFVLLFGLVATYVFCQSTLYQSKSSVLIGERFFFASSQSQNPVGTLLESPEQIKYRFTNVTITPIKNTRVVEISSKRENVSDAEADVQQCVETLLVNHAEALKAKHAEFVTFLQVTKASHKENMALIDAASVSSASKPYTPMQTTVLPFGGLLLKGLGIGLLGCAFAALVISLIADQIQRHRTTHI